MTRVSIIENGERTGRWFDIDKAEKFSEETWWNGNNWISKATGSQWEHEAIYITKGGIFILNHWSNYQGSREYYEVVSKEEAAEWFVKNEYKDDDLPEIFNEAVSGLEIK